jgi:hypothetical protein
MKTRQDNPYGLALPISSTDEVKQMVWGPDWKAREQRRKYLLALINRQPAEAQRSAEV